MKKIVSLALTATLALSCMSPLLAGCDDGDGISDYEHTIVFYSSQGDALVQQTANAIKSFEAKYPGWKVSHQQPGGYDEVRDKVISDLQAGIQPDLTYCYADHVAMYLPTEQVIDMTPFINSTETVTGKVAAESEGESVMVDKEFTVGYTAEEIADFVKGYYDEGKAPNYSGYKEFGYTDESMFTLPFVKSTELLYYNATALKKLGLTVPTTWDELWAQGSKLSQHYPKATLLGYDSEANWFITMCEQNGWGYTAAQGEHYLFNQDNTALKAWLNKLGDYYIDGMLATQKDYGSYTSALFTKGVEDGGCLYCIGSSGGASHQSPADNLFTAGIAPIPGSVRGKDSNNNDIIDNSAISQGPSLVMLKAGHGVSNADEKAKMTFLFIKELLDPTFQAQFSIAAGYNPSRNSVYDIAAYKKHMEGDGLTALACKTAKDLSDRFFTSPAFVGSSTARDQVGNVLYYVMRGEKTADQAISDAYKNCGGQQQK